MSNDIKKNLDTSNFINFSKNYLSVTKDLFKTIDLNELESIDRASSISFLPTFRAGEIRTQLP